MTTWSVGEVVNTLGSHPSIQGFEPPTDYHFFMRIKKESQAFFLKCFICIKKKSGVTGFEPVKWQIQSLLPYRLAIPQQQFILYIYFRRCKEKNDKNSYKICTKPYRVHAYR